jgi:hypothetical protein
MLAQAETKADDEERASLKSFGNLCTVPDKISTVLMVVILLKVEL